MADNVKITNNDNFYISKEELDKYGIQTDGKTDEEIMKEYREKVETKMGIEIEEAEEFGISHDMDDILSYCLTDSEEEECINDAREQSTTPGFEDFEYRLNLDANKQCMIRDIINQAAQSEEEKLQIVRTILDGYNDGITLSPFCPKFYEEFYKRGYKAGKRVRSETYVNAQKGIKDAEQKPLQNEIAEEEVIVECGIIEEGILKSDEQYMLSNEERIKEYVEYLEHIQNDNHPKSK